MGNSQVPAHTANKTMRVHTSVQREGPAVQILRQLHLHPHSESKQESQSYILTYDFLNWRVQVVDAGHCSESNFNPRLDVLH